MKILVACEESQTVTIELRNLGHEAYSCDVLPCSGGHPEWHLQQDVFPLLSAKWDMILAFPPCTYLTAAGAVRLYAKDGMIKDDARYKKGLQAAAFFSTILNADCDKIAVENPVMLKCFGLPKYNQIIEPYMFGDPWCKRTCLWLKGLPNLQPTDTVVPLGLWVGSTSVTYTKYALHPNRDPKRRAKTFQGIAKAMAEQWAGINTSREHKVHFKEREAMQYKITYRGTAEAYLDEVQGWASKISEIDEFDPRKSPFVPLKKHIIEEVPPGYIAGLNKAERLAELRDGAPAEAPKVEFCGTFNLEENDEIILGEVNTSTARVRVLTGYHVKNGSLEPRWL